MRFAQHLSIAGLVAGTLASAASAASISIDNFESYDPADFTNGIATSYNSTPWLRLGGAVQDNMYVSAAAADGPAAVLDGAHSGIVSGILLNSTGAQAIYMRNFNAATDFSATDTVSVLTSTTSRSASLPTNVQLILFDAPVGTDNNTTYITANPLSILPGAAQTLTFGLNATDIALSDPGADNTSFADALTHVYAIGFRYSSATGGNGNETVYVDDIVATTTTPEPAVAGLLLVGAAALGRRRR